MANIKVVWFKQNLLDLILMEKDNLSLFCISLGCICQKYQCVGQAKLYANEFPFSTFFAVLFELAG